MSDTNSPENNTSKGVDLDSDSSELTMSEQIMQAAQRTLAAMDEEQAQAEVTQEAQPAKPPVAEKAATEKPAKAYTGDPRRRKAPRRVKAIDVVLAPTPAATPPTVPAKAKAVAEKKYTAPTSQPKPVQASVAESKIAEPAVVEPQVPAEKSEPVAERVSAIQQRMDAASRSENADANAKSADVEEVAAVDPVTQVAEEAVVTEPVIAEPTVVEPVVVESVTEESETIEQKAVETAEAVSVETPEPTVASPTSQADNHNETKVDDVKDDNQISAAVVPEPQSTKPVSVPAPHVAETVSKPVAKQPKKPVVADSKPQQSVTEQPKSDPAKSDQPATGFKAIPLSAPVQEAIAKSGYDTPTEIQARIIPHMLEGRDVLAQSQTGSGKTAGFALPILSQLEPTKRNPQVLVLAPTRELAIQVANSFSTYASSLPNFSVAAIYGGADYNTQFRQLKRGVDVVVGTPGRTIDHINRGTLDVSDLRCLVLDEADEMLNMGFLADVQFVLEKTPDSRQVALFSATLPAPIRTIAERYLNDPVRITVKTKTMTAESIRQRAVLVHPREKIETLKRFIEAEETDGVIVFTKTREATTTVAEQLVKLNLKAVALNGDMPQKTRERTIHQLKAGYLDILVATDVAARGLDVTRVSHVFNYDMPHDSESYVHRIGRTGRAGRKGDAIIFCSNSQRGRLKMIERVTKQQIEIVQPPTIDDINDARVVRFKQQIADTANSADADMFEKMLTRFAEKTGLPMAKVAAALAHMCQNGQPFFLKEQPKYVPSKSESFRENRGGRSDGPKRGGGAGRILGPPEPGLTRFRIEVGWKDGVKPGNIVGAVANEGGIDGRKIGPIKINDAFSTIDLPSDLSQDVQNKLKSTRVAGQMLQLRLAGADDNVAASGPPRQSKPYGGKPAYGKKPYGGGGGKSFSKGGDFKRKFKK